MKTFVVRCCFEGGGEAPDQHVEAESESEAKEMIVEGGQFHPMWVKDSYYA